MTQHRAEALKAIEHVRAALTVQVKQGGGLETRLLVSTLEYAAEQVNALVEVKRVRKAAAPAL